MKLLDFINKIQGEKGVEGVYGFVCWTSWSNVFQIPIRVWTFLVWGEWCLSLKKTLWVIRKKEPFFRWLACATFPLLINICSYYPTSLYVYKKCVNICEINVSGLSFKVSSRLGGYISWFYIDFSFLCCCNDFIGAWQAIIFCSICCWALVVLGHKLGQTRDLSFCPFFGDQIQVALHFLNYDCIYPKYLHHVPSLNNYMQIPLLEISHLGACMCFNADNQSLILMATSLKTKLRRCNLTSLFFIKGTRTKVVFQDKYWFVTNLLQVGKCRQGLLIGSIHLPKAKKWLLYPCDTHYSVKKKPLFIITTSSTYILMLYFLLYLHQNIDDIGSIRHFNLAS
jgi:hypothetical protein